MPTVDSIIAFDFGTKRIGVAVGQTLTRTAQPLATLHARNGQAKLADIQALIDRWHPSAFVVGIPLNLDGTEQPLTHLAREFQRWLSSHFHLPVHGMDERLTTREARQDVFEKGGYKALQHAEVDSLAAQIILQDWLGGLNQ